MKKLMNCKILLLLVIRYFRANRVVGISGNGDEKEHGTGKRTGPLLSGTAYCISSCSMILLNKIVLSGYNFDAGISLMFYQVCYVSSFLSIFFIKTMLKNRICFEFPSIYMLHSSIKSKFSSPWIILLVSVEY